MNRTGRRHPDTVVATEPPAACPSCRSSRLSHEGKTITASSYWRCETCGEVWNVGRRRPDPSWSPR